MKHFFAGVLMFGIVAGCGILGGGDDESLPVLDGQYEIKTIAKLDGVEESSIFTYEIEVSESTRKISGLGDLTIESKETPDASTYDLEVEGSHDYPDVRIEIRSSDSNNTYVDVFEGTSENGVDRLEGTFTFDDGTQQTVVMRSK